MLTIWYSCCVLDSGPLQEPTVSHWTLSSPRWLVLWWPLSWDYMDTFVFLIFKVFPLHNFHVTLCIAFRISLLRTLVRIESSQHKWFHFNLGSVTLIFLKIWSPCQSIREEGFNLKILEGHNLIWNLSQSRGLGKSMFLSSLEINYLHS